MSAPRTAYGKWRLKFQPNVTPDFAGQVTCFTLGWIGHRFYHHECLRRAGNTASPWIGPLIHFMMPNMHPAANFMNSMLVRDSIYEFEAIRDFKIRCGAAGRD